MNLCRPCGLDFVTVQAFDEHQTGVHEYTLSEGLKQDPPVADGRRCFSIYELQDFGWTQNAQGRWQYPADWERQAARWDEPSEALAS